MKLKDNVLCKWYSINVTTYTGKTTFEEIELAVYTSSDILNEPHHDNEFECLTYTTFKMAQIRRK